MEEIARDSGGFKIQPSLEDEEEHEGTVKQRTTSSFCREESYPPGIEILFWPTEQRVSCGHPK